MTSTQLKASVLTFILFLQWGGQSAFGGKDSNQDPERIPSPTIITSRIEIPNPEGGTTSAVISTGSIENEQEGAAAAEFVAGEAREAGVTGPVDVVAFHSNSGLSQAENSFSTQLQTAGLPNTPRRLPWYHQEVKRRLTFSAIRLALDSGMTFALVLSHQSLPIDVAASYALAGGALSGVMQYYTKGINKWLGRTALLDRLEKKGWVSESTRPFWKAAIGHAEYIVRWVSLDGSYLALSAAAMFASAAYFGVHCAGADLMSMAVFGEISFFAATAEGTVDRFIIKRMQTWETRFASEPQRADLRTELWSGLNSCVATVLALPSLLHIEVTELALKSYAALGLGLMVKDWVVSKISGIRARLFGTSCESSVQPRVPSQTPGRKVSRQWTGRDTEMAFT